MVVIYGSKLSGKVDAVPGLGFVATKFAHIYYVPLIPSQGWLVISQSGNTWRGVRIPMSAKSVFMGWARAIAVLAGIGGIIGTVVAANHSGGDFMAPLLTALFAWGFFAFSKMYKGITKASYRRAC